MRISMNNCYCNYVIAAIVCNGAQVALQRRGASLVAACTTFSHTHNHTNTILHMHARAWPYFEMNARVCVCVWPMNLGMTRWQHNTRQLALSSSWQWKRSKNKNKHITKSKKNTRKSYEWMNRLASATGSGVVGALRACSCIFRHTLQISGDSTLQLRVKWCSLRTLDCGQANFKVYSMHLMCVECVGSS